MKSSVNQPEGLAVSPNRLRIARMTFDGTLTGDFDIIADYSGGGATEVWSASPPGFVWHVHILDVYVQGAGNVTANGYGPIAALPNGLSFEVRAQDETVLASNIVVRTTGEFQSIPGAVASIEERGPGDNYLNVNWNISRSVGVPVSMQPGARMLASLSDSFIGLTSHYITMAGYIVPAET